MGQIWTFSDQISTEPNVLKSDLKKSRICPIWGKSDPLWSQTYHPCLILTPKDGGILWLIASEVAFALRCSIVINLHGSSSIENLSVTSFGHRVEWIIVFIGPSDGMGLIARIVHYVEK